MNNKNFLLNLRGLRRASQRSDVGFDRRSTVVQPSFDCRSSLLKLVSVLVLILTIGVGNVWGAETVSVNISTYATNHSWVNGTAYATVNIDANVTATGLTNGNNSKYYSSNSSWRHYEGNSGTITIATSSGTLSSVTFTYSAGNNGTIKYNNTNKASGTAISVSGSSVTFTVGRTSGSSNGNIQITAISVTYTPATTSHTLSSAVSPAGTGSVSLSSTTVAEGSTATATATPNTGYRFSSWSISGTGASLSSTTTSPTTVTMGTADATVTANFVSKGCTDHAGTNVTSGASTDDDYGPVCAYNNYSTRQILYTKTDLGLAAGKKGTIKSIYFEYAGGDAMVARTIKIYMANTALTVLSTSSCVPYASFREVFDGSFSCPSAGWCEIILGTPFEYNGIGNLVVLIDDNTGSWESSKTFKYHVASTTTKAQIYYNNDGTNINPSTTDWSDFDDTNNRPNTKFCILEADMVASTVTLMDNGATLTEASAGAGVTLPSRAGCTGYTFAGWTKSWAAAQDNWTTTAPIVIPAGGYYPTSDENLYPVYTKTEGSGGVSSTDTETGKTATPYVQNTGWNASAGGTYTSAGNFGDSSPSIKMSTDGHWITSPTYSDAITGISFWYKPQNATGSISIFVSTDGDSWTELTGEAVSFSGSSTADTKSITVSAGNNYKAVKIVYNKTTSNVAIDDIAITHGGGSVTSYISVPNCCTSLASINGSVNFPNPKKAVLVWDAVEHVDSWTVKWKTGADSYAITNVSAVRDTLTNKKTCVVTGLSCNTNYDFKIIANPASGYCDKEEEITNRNSGQWDVTYSLSNASRSSGQAAGSDVLCGDLDVVFAATSGYILPNSVTVTGASSHTWNQATGALHVDAANITGDITVSFTATAATGWKFKSEADGWTEHAMTENAGVATCSVSLPADSRIEFCFDGNGTVYKNNGTIITTTSGWTFYSDHNNCHIHTGPAGTYTFAINTSTQAVTVTYPTVSHPNEHYVYFKNSDVWGTVKGYLSNSGNDNKAAAWPGSDMQATTSICGETYHYAALNAMNGTYNTIIFNNGNSGYGNQTSDLSTTGSLGKYNANRDANWHDFTLYTITFAGNGNTGGSMTDVENICPGDGETIAVNGYTRTGYTFANWKTNVAITANGSPVAANGDVPAGATISSINSNITLTAQWTANTIALTLNKNTEDAGSNNGSGSINFDATSGTITTAPTRTGYSVEGYYTDAGCTAANKVLDASGNVINSTVSGYTTSGKWTRATTPTTLYAKWTPTNYTVTWHVGDATYTSTVAYNTEFQDISVGKPSVGNYDLSSCESNYFVGWVTSGGIRTTDGGTVALYNSNKVNATDKITGDIDFYAMFATESGGGGAAVNTVLWAEDFSGWGDGDVPSGDDITNSHTGTTVYGDATLTYACVNGDSNTRLYGGNNTLYAGGVKPELLVGKNTGTFTVSGIPNGGASEITVSYKQNDKSLTVSASGTGYSGTNTASTTDTQSFDVTVGSASTFTLTFAATTNSNVRMDDISVRVKTQGITYTNYRTNCASCANTVTVDYDADPTGCTVAVTKGSPAVDVEENGTVKTCDGSVNLTVTITPASHYTVTGLTAQISSTDMSQSHEGNVYTVTIPQNQSGTLVLTPILTEDAHIAINWHVPTGSADITAGEGKTWVYSGGNLTAIPGIPSGPTGCSETKTFVGWSEKHSGSTEEDASYYDDLFDALGDAPTGITTQKDFYAVYAHSSSNPLAGTVLWDEPFDGSAGDQPSSPTSGATVYGSASIAYNCSSTDYCKLYTDNLASGGAASPELLIPKSSRGEAFEVTGIPTAGQTELTLTYMAKDALSVTTGTSGVTVGDASVDTKLYTRTITIDQSGLGVTTFDLTFEKSTDSNSRLDDIHLVVPGSSSYTNYVTDCEAAYIITYNKNTSDAVTNLPGETGIPQSTGSGTLSSKVPVRETYTFLGWSETSGDNNTVDYVAGGSITGVDDDMTLYAVWEKTAVEELTLNYSELNKYVGDPSVTLAVTGVSPDGADPSVTWSSSNTSVASVVAATGVVTFGTVGTATITATSTVTGTTSAYCYVTVRNKPTATFVDLIHDGNGTTLSNYNLQDVAGTAIVFPTLDDYATPGDNCDEKHYVFVGWTTSDNNEDPEDHLVTSDVLVDDQAKTFYAVWADGVAGVSYTKLTSNSFETGSTRYVIGVESGGDTYYLYSCESTDANNSWGFTTNAPGTNAPIQFSLSGTAAALVATSTEATARYLTPLTAKNFQMSATSKTVQLDADGTIHNTGDNSGWNLRGNSTDLRWYNGTTGTSAYFYKIGAGSSVSYRTSCCTNNVAAPTVTATNTAYTVTLTWGVVDGATGYEVSWNGGAYEAATSPCVKSGLTASTDYTYKVRATYDPEDNCGALVASGNVTTDDVYTVTYSGGTGTGSCSPSGGVATVSYEAGAAVTLAATDSYSMTSNTFAAWVVKDADDNDVAVSINQFTMPAKNVTVTATWTPAQDKYYDRMHAGTDASHGGVEDGEGKYYLVREGCNYNVPALTDDNDGETACHTTHYKLLGWVAASYMYLTGEHAGELKPGGEAHIFQGGGTKSATDATYYAVWAIMTE